MPLRDERLSYPFEVVDFPVTDERDVAVLAVQRLLAANRIDDGQPRVCKGDVRRLVDEGSLRVRSTMMKDGKDPIECRLGHFGTNRAENSAHAKASRLGEVRSALALHYVFPTMET